MTNMVVQRQSELTAIEQREAEIRAQLAHNELTRERLCNEYQELYYELMSIPQKKSLAQRALMEAQLKLNTGGHQ